MKEPWEWEEADLLQLIDNKIQESLTLDYKGSWELNRQDETRRAELCKDVSAMANAAGGTLIYGIAEKDQFPTEFDGGIDSRQTPREWPEQILQHHINRPIKGMRLKAVPLPSQGENRYAFVIHVPASNDGPHQSYDKRFYIRRNFLSERMEEYEVRDAYFRQGSPHLVLQMKKAKLKESSEPGKVCAEVDIVMANTSEVEALYSMIEFRVPRLIQFQAPQFQPSGETFETAYGNPRVLKRYTRNFCVPHVMPIWSGISWRVCDADMNLTWDREHEPVDVVWYVRAPKMKTTTGCFRFSSDESSLTWSTVAPTQ